MTVVFGAVPDIPAYEDASRVPVPVGQPCGLCDEPIGENEGGTLMPRLYPRGEGSVRSAVEPVHHECSARNALGGLAHQLRMCLCFGGGPHDFAGLTRRQEARVVWALVNTYGPVEANP